MLLLLLHTWLKEAKDEETIEKQLLKKRWDMIQTNNCREELKIRNSKLYYNDMEVPLKIK